MSLSTASTDALKKKMHTATLVHKQVFAGGRLGTFILQPTSAPRWWYQAGQYTTLGLDTPGHGFVPRAYSIAGSPMDGGTLEFYIALVENGQLTPSIFAQELGTVFHFLSPKGRFTLKHAGKRIVLMVATGTGLAPFVSQVRSLWRLHQSGVPSTHRIVLVYGASYGDEFGYRSELESYAAARHEGFDFTFICTSSRPDPARGYTEATAIGRANEITRLLLGQDTFSGRRPTLPKGVDRDSLRAQLLADGPAGLAVMACGNPGMIEDLKQPLAELGVGSYLVEEFWKA